MQPIFYALQPKIPTTEKVKPENNRFQKFVFMNVTIESNRFYLVFSVEIYDIVQPKNWKSVLI